MLRMPIIKRAVCQPAYTTMKAATAMYTTTKNQKLNLLMTYSLQLRVPSTEFVVIRIIIAPVIAAATRPAPQKIRHETKDNARGGQNSENEQSVLPPVVVDHKPDHECVQAGYE